MSVGGAYVVAELFTLPPALVAVMVSGQLEVAAKPEMVALVVVRLDTVGVLPVTAKAYVTVPPVPPDQDTLNEEVVQAENEMPVMGVGI
jgi:hypothetical protein